MSFIRILTTRPWGIVIPLTGLCVLLLYNWIANSPRQLAHQYAEHLETAPEEEIGPIAGKIGELGRFGIPELVKGLCSSRRATVFVCRDILETKFQLWSLENSKKSGPLNRVLAEELAKRIDVFPPTSKLFAVSLSRRIMNSMLLAKEKQYPFREEITIHCESILQQTEGERFIADHPAQLDEVFSVASGGEPNRIFPADQQESEKLLAFQSRIPRQTIPGNPAVSPTSPSAPVPSDYFDPYSNSRAELLYAVHQNQLNTLYPHLKDRETLLIDPTHGFPPNSIQPHLPNSPETQIASTAGALETALPGPRIASEFLPTSSNSVGGNTEQQGGDQERLPTLPPFQAVPETKNNDTILRSEVPVEQTPVGKTPTAEIPHLPTEDLIRLLQHPDKTVVALAEQQLRKRDRFQDAHISLAYRLHHPNVVIRNEILEILPKTPSIQPVPWLLELLRDPDVEIRHSTIAFIATSNDRKLIRDITERAKIDPDPRINNLVEKLDHLQKAGLYTTPK